MIAYKLLRQRKNGTLGPLFINRKQIIRVGEWLPAEDHPTEGYAHRPGWHVVPQPIAPHLSLAGRIWKKVEVKDFTLLKRPVSQGGTWLLAKWMKVLKENS